MYRCSIPLAPSTSSATPARRSAPSCGASASRKLSLQSALVGGWRISLSQWNSSTCSEERRWRSSSNSTSRASSSRSELALIEEHHRPVRAALSVGEARALVERPRGGVALAGAELHLFGALRPRGVHRGLQQCPAKTVAAASRDHVELLEIGAEPGRIHPGAEAELREAVRALADEQHDHVLVPDQV